MYEGLLEKGAGEGGGEVENFVGATAAYYTQEEKKCLSSESKRTPSSESKRTPSPGVSLSHMYMLSLLQNISCWQECGSVG